MTSSFGGCKIEVLVTTEWRRVLRLQTVSEDVLRRADASRTAVINAPHSEHHSDCFNNCTVDRDALCLRSRRINQTRRQTRLSEVCPLLSYDAILFVNLYFTINKNRRNDEIQPHGRKLTNAGLDLAGGRPGTNKTLLVVHWVITILIINIFIRHKW